MVHTMASRDRPGSPRVQAPLDEPRFGDVSQLADRTVLEGNAALLLDESRGVKKHAVGSVDMRMEGRDRTCGRQSVSACAGNIRRYAHSQGAIARQVDELHGGLQRGCRPANGCRSRWVDDAVGRRVRLRRSRRIVSTKHTFALSRDDHPERRTCRVAGRLMPGPSKRIGGSGSRACAAKQRRRRGTS